MTMKEANAIENEDVKVEQELMTKQQICFTSCSEEIRYYVKSRLAVEEECTKQALIDRLVNNDRAKRRKYKMTTEKLTYTVQEAAEALGISKSLKKLLLIMKID